MTPLVVFEVAGLWTAAVACALVALVYLAEAIDGWDLVPALGFVFLGLVALLAGVAVLV